MDSVMDIYDQPIKRNSQLQACDMWFRSARRVGAASLLLSRRETGRAEGNSRPGSKHAKRRPPFSRRPELTISYQDARIPFSTGPLQEGRPPSSPIRPSA